MAAIDGEILGVRWGTYPLLERGNPTSYKVRRYPKPADESMTTLECGYRLQRLYRLQILTIPR